MDAILPGNMPDKAPPKDDGELLQACRDGNQDAWEALVRKYRHLVYSIPYRSGLRGEEASDVFQAVFLALLRSLDVLRQEESLVSWLITTTKRESWRVRKKASREVQDEEVLLRRLDTVGSEMPVDNLELLESQVAVRAALDRLDARCGRLLRLLFYTDPPPPYTEISRKMKMPVPSIGPTRIRCLEKLRRLIE